MLDRRWLRVASSSSRNWLISRCSGAGSPAPVGGAVTPSAAGASDRGTSLKRTTKYGPRAGGIVERADLEVDPPVPLVRTHQGLPS